MLILFYCKYDFSENQKPTLLRTCTMWRMILYASFKGKVGHVSSFNAFGPFCLHQCQMKNSRWFEISECLLESCGAWVRSCSAAFVIVSLNYFF